MKTAPVVLDRKNNMKITRYFIANNLNHARTQLIDNTAKFYDDYDDAIGAVVETATLNIPGRLYAINFFPDFSSVRNA